MEQSPNEWLASMQQRADQMVEQSQELQQRLQEMVETAQDADGSVSVSVSSTGALQDLRIEKRALNRGAPELQSTILRLAAEAQARVASRAVEAVEPVAGNAGMEFLRSQLPKQEDLADGSRSPGDEDDGDEPPQSFLR